MGEIEARKKKATAAAAALERTVEEKDQHVLARLTKTLTQRGSEYSTGGKENVKLRRNGKITKFVPWEAKVYECVITRRKSRKGKSRDVVPTAYRFFSFSTPR